MRIRPFAATGFFAISALAAAAFFSAGPLVAQTGGLAMTSGPTVSSSEISDTMATVRWSTNVEAVGRVYYGETSALGRSWRKLEGIGPEESEVSEMQHVIRLEELAPDTTYFFKVWSADAAGAAVESSVSSFTTAPGAVEPACAEDVWTCAEWGACTSSAAGYFQDRTCTLATDCPTAETPKPDTTRSCTPACTEDIWSCGDWGRCDKDASGKLVQSRSCTLKYDCPDVSTSKPTETQICLPTPGCTLDIWSCGEWSSCAEPGTKTKKRACTLTMDCPTAETPKPVETADCPPPCKEDEWRCGDWGACDKEGKERRTCSLLNDCPNVSTPKPPEARDCMLVGPGADANAPSVNDCERDVWSCGAWGECVQDGDGRTRSRVCALGYDCPNDASPSPAEKEACEPRKSEDESLREVLGGMSSGLRTLVQDFEKNTENVSGGGRLAADIIRDANEPLPEAAVARTDLSSLYVGTDDPDQARTLTAALAAECAAEGIAPERCAVWLKTKYSSVVCLQEGVFSKASCERLLTERNGGTFPGCEGKTPEECGRLKALSTLGYLPEDAKKKADEIIDLALAENIPPPLPGLLSVRNDILTLTGLYPSAGSEGAETSSALVMLDADKDGLPDELERRLGTDPLAPDIEVDGSVNATVSRVVLKSFFEKGDKPTQQQFGDLIDSFVDIDIDGDGTTDAAVSRNVLKSFFEKGDKPTEADFAPVDRAIMFGAPLEQPRGAGEVDETFTVDLALPAAPYAAGGDHSALQNLTNAGEAGEGGDAASARKKLNFSGRAQPNATVLVYVYSYVPVVMTAQTDENGDFVIELEHDVLAEGEHEMYVVITDETGKIAKKSDPVAFFVKEAQAVTEEDFLRSDFVTPAESIAPERRWYLIAVLPLIAFGLLAVWGFSRRLAGRPSGGAPSAKR